jgi:cold shock CspA family protein
VKWFNTKTGYGFITVTDGDKSGSDVFVHHSAVIVSSEQYKYLVQGEYVEFTLIHTAGGTHEYQAGDVSGIKGGKLMCETRKEFRDMRTSYKGDDGSAEDVSVRAPRSVRPPQERKPADRRPQRDARPQADAREQGEDWSYVASKKRDARPSGGRGSGGRGAGKPRDQPRARLEM